MNYHLNLGLFFEEIHECHASRRALQYQKHTYCYAELNERANQFAHFMCTQQMQSGDVVAIASEKHFNSFALMIACLKLGIVFVHIDPRGPAPRLTKIFQRCKPRAVFFDKRSEAVDIATQEISLPFFSTEDPLINRLEKTNTSFLGVTRAVDGASIAYIMFTSGSTGTPKGAAITHQNLLHFIAWSKQRFQISHNDIFAQVSPLYFDNSVFDFFSAFFSGACLAPFTQFTVNNPLELMNEIDSRRCSIWFSVPSLLIYLLQIRALSPERFSTIRHIIFGGEGFPKSELLKIHELYGQRTELTNVYGPTECTCICSAYTITEKTFENLHGLPPLGHLNQNFSFLILDESSEEADEGELCLIGPNVCSGYYNDEVRTQESFFVVPSGRHYLKRMYRTGDLVRLENDGLHFVGRKDNQIKHMGHRIELEEIEAALQMIDGIKRAAVLYFNPSTFGQIVAFVAATLKKEEIQKVLESSLPSYMLPHRIHLMDALPLNANGKVDKQALKRLLVGQS